MDRMTFTSGGGDSYRPGVPQRQQGRADDRSQFSFESNHPAPQFPPSAPTGPANARPREPPRKRTRRGALQHGSQRGDASRSQGRNNANGFRKNFRKAPHERALLTHRDDGGPEHAMGVSDGPNKFLNLEDLSDDEEADMEVEGDASDNNDTDTVGQDVNHKVAKRQTTSRADGDSVPKWSNPDPYTVLPPPEETTGKIPDFIKLIRKAKNTAAEISAGDTAVAANDDFISFGDEETFREPSEVRSLEYEEPDSTRMRPNAAAKRSVQGSLNELDAVVSLPQSTQEAPGPSNRNSHPARDPARANKRKHGGFLGIVQEWLPKPNSNPTPWVHSDGQYDRIRSEPDTTKWLHNEILDFYDFVSPQQVEHDIRNHLVQRVNSALGNRRFPNENGRILCFGSFPAGLYLPTADMDLVYTSDTHLNGGPQILDPSQKGAYKNLLYKASRRLQDMRISRGRCNVIANAKVPIIKFTDDLTGLEVDISFENLSGVRAQVTFADWKQQYGDLVSGILALTKFSSPVVRY
ncbi:hypothetical protein N0V83_001730 [Neocucurbitaria cava]|uniref:Poly(A) RNA polymerase mitochondrial-like central palm domain-containing protein n=1 Tax=Neocucurbitaria cava TaxID=798079 RepID=A0A9W9CQP2_9PLEO|nr:hypothetical protein N0V83_001730 [Neocucurbitaria cava]